MDADKPGKLTKTAAKQYWKILANRRNLSDVEANLMVEVMKTLNQKREDKLHKCQKVVLDELLSRIKNPESGA